MLRPLDRRDASAIGIAVRAAARVQRRPLGRRASPPSTLLGGQRARAAPAPLRPRGARRRWPRAWRSSDGPTSVARDAARLRRRHVRLRARAVLRSPRRRASCTLHRPHGDVERGAVGPAARRRLGHRPTPWPRARPQLVSRARRGRRPVAGRSLPGRRNLVVVPLTAEGRAIGVARRRARACAAASRIERRVVGMLERFASHGALALRNAWLLEQVQQLAATDGLTGIANRRTFDAGARDASWRAPRAPARTSASRCSTSTTSSASTTRTATRPATTVLRARRGRAGERQPRRTTPPLATAARSSRVILPATDRERDAGRSPSACGAPSPRPPTGRASRSAPASRPSRPTPPDADDARGAPPTPRCTRPSAPAATGSSHLPAISRPPRCQIWPPAELRPEENGFRPDMLGRGLSPRRKGPHGRRTSRQEDRDPRRRRRGAGGAGAAAAGGARTPAPRPSCCRSTPARSRR